MRDLSVNQASEDKKEILCSRDWIVTFEDVLVVWIPNVAFIADTPAVPDRLKDQAVFNF